MKFCSCCKLEKELSCFNFRNKKKGTLQTYCKECNKLSARKHYDGNKRKYYEINVVRRKTRAKFIFEYLKEHPCVDCGEADPIVLEFDHVGDKTNEVSNLVRKGTSLEVIALEIKKCEVRCANCHRRKTAKDFGWYKDFI